MPFKTLLKIESIRGTDNRKLITPLVWMHPVSFQVIVVPIGFITNYASIPKIVRGFVDNDSGHIRDAAVIHDYLYSCPDASRRDADDILRLAMRDLGASWLKRNVVWLSVRALGWMFKA